jgi:2,3-bisphosphoglycerate-independent phosphoglycerate mutase
MKFALIIIDGAADEPLAELGNKTPLQAANKPVIDSIARIGRLGTTRNVPAGMHPGSDVAILSMLGYDPRSHYTGRAPLEAVAQGLQIDPDMWVLRCNLVTIVDGVMADYSAGHISTEEARGLIAELNEQLSSSVVRFYGGISDRHLLTVKADLEVETTPPHDIMGRKIAEHLPRGQGAELLIDLTQRSSAVLGGHEINAVRRDLGENLASSIWLWGQGKKPQLESFASKYGRSAAVITAVDLVRGIAALTGMDSIAVDGATGYVDTNYAGKGAAAVAALEDHDLVIVHVEAPDECGHNAEPELKTRAIEDIDRFIVSPILHRLQAQSDGWRILLGPDHPTPCRLRTHTADPVPFVIAGQDIPNLVSRPFDETTCAQGDLHIEFGHELMEYLLKPARPGAAAPAQGVGLGK